MNTRSKMELQDVGSEPPESLRGDEVEKGEPPGVETDADEDIEGEKLSSLNREKSTQSNGSGGAHRRLTRKLTRFDSLDVEAMSIRGMDQRHKVLSMSVILQLAYQSIGVVYGDVGTSPLYVFSSTLSNLSVNSIDILGALSLIIYTLALIPLIKYVFIVLRANDHGEGGTFALYSLICRHARVSLVGDQLPADRELSTYNLNLPSKELTRASRMKERLEKSRGLQNLLVVIVLLGTCLVIGDGVLTPAISVLSAVQGIKVEVPSLNKNIVVIVTIVILVGLFSLQRFGTNKVSFLFAPVVLVWFVSIGLIGLYNIFKHDPSIFRAFNPQYIYLYFKQNKKRGWVSLGGIVLCITGTEAMFADLGHFTVKSIQIAFTTLVFPCLLLAYIGQAAYLMKYNTSYDVEYSFYRSVPKPIFWPMFVVATMASVIASQAMISATFSIVKQSMALGCFPRVTVVHTSKKYHGQIYIPEINWILMILCIVIVAGFRSTATIGNAYGIAVVGVMLVTTSLLTLIMVMIWQTRLILVIPFLLIFGSVEGVYFSSVLFKVDQGGWVPLVFAASFLLIMFSWHYGTRKKYEFEVQHKISMDWVLSRLGSSLGLVRVRGICLVYTELGQGVPAIFAHFITNIPAIHSTLVFVNVRDLPVSSVPPQERILIRRVGPRDYHMFRCAVRYGYADWRNDDENFEELLMESLENFIRTEVSENTLASSGLPSAEYGHQNCSSSPHSIDHSDAPGDTPSAMSPQKLNMSENGDEIAGYVNGLQSPQTMEDEINFLFKAKEAGGVIYLLGHSDVQTKKEASVLKKFIINYVYSFLHRNCRTSTLHLRVPHTSLLKVGMTYYV